MYRWICSSLLCSALLLVVLSCTSHENGDEPQAIGEEATPVVLASHPPEETTKGETELAESLPASQEEVKAKVPMKPKPVEAPAKVVAVRQSETPFEDDAFPPTISDSAWHASAWQQDDCLRCHETGVGKAPEIVHRGMSPILKTAKCRTCHVEIPNELPHWGAKEKAKSKIAEDRGFASFAFPPSIPASQSHRKAWLKDDCRMCHDNGISGAPAIVHKRIPAIALESKCRTCHVQVRVIDATR